MAPSGLPDVKRFVTAHDANGTSTFLPDNVISQDASWLEISPKVSSFTPFCTTTSPAILADDADVQTFNSGTVNLRDIVTPNGTNMRLYDFAPGFEVPMHRTCSIDYGIVLEGSVEAIMDSGEVRVGQRGDIFIQRGTKHAWRNPSATEWARICFVVVAAEPLEVARIKDEADKASGQS